MDQDTPQWTPEARTQFETVARQAIDALKAHVDLIRRVGPDDGQEQERSGSLLTAALDNLADAEFDLTGDFPYVLDLELSTDDLAEEEGDDEGEELDTVAVLMRMDFAVDDHDVLLQTARQGVVEHDEMDAEDAEESITEIEAAIFAVAHARGWDALLDDAVPGLAALSTYAEVVRDPEELELEVDEDPDDED
ncbi:MAG: hypothetical protein L0G99_03465 [Propionibacteriales bacterium]|nr:hypothetical protein [Propionibacteriales bacterium]